MKKLVTLVFAAVLCMPSYGQAETSGILVYKLTCQFNPWVDFTNTNQTDATKVGTKQITGYLVLNVNSDTWKLNEAPTMIFYGKDGTTKWGTYFDVNDTVNGGGYFTVFDVEGKTYNGVIINAYWNKAQEEIGAAWYDLYGKTGKVDIGKGAKAEIPSKLKGIIETLPYDWNDNVYFNALGNTTATLDSKNTQYANKNGKSQVETVNKIIAGLPGHFID